MSGVDVTALVPSSVWSEGPTPGALQELLDNLDRRTEQVRGDLFASMLAHVSAPQPDESVLEAMATSLHAISSSTGLEQWVAQTADKYMQMQCYVSSLQAQLKAAQAAADLETTLAEFRAFLENGQFSDAAYGLAQLQKIKEDGASTAAAGGGAQGWGSVAGGEAAALAHACEACERDLGEALEASLAEAFDVSLEGGVITISSSLPSGGDVGELWAALALAGLADKQLTRIADALLQHVLPPVLAGQARLAAHVSPAGESGHIRWCAAPGPPPAVDAVETECMALLSVLAEALFRQRPDTLAGFGAAFWAGFVQAYTAAFLGQVAGANLAVLQGRQEAARAMEAQAVALGLAAPGSDLASALSRSIAQSYHVVQEGFLAAARELLLAHDPHAPPVTVGQPLPLDAAFYARYKQGKAKPWEVLDPPSGWDVSGPVLATGYYGVSGTVLQLVMAIDDALAHACAQGDTSVAQAIVAAVSKMAAMYPAMVAAPPACDAPALALQHHNDLAYLANHLLLAPFLFGDELAELLGLPVWFGDDALKLRAAARAAFNDTLAVHGSALRESLLPLLQLSAAWAGGAPPPPKEAEAAATAAQQAALYTLRRAGRLLWSSLAPGSALEASQQLLEPLAAAMVDDVLGKRDIGESEAAELLRLYRPLLEGALPELLADVDLASQAEASGEAQLDVKELVGAALQQRCHGLRKLGAVLRLLEVRLADIVEAWEAGALGAAGLGLGEVGRLVCALFEDTDYRAQCLQRMEAAEGL